MNHHAGAAEARGNSRTRPAAGRCSWPLALGAAAALAGSGTGAEAEAGAGMTKLTERVWAFIAEDERSANGALFVGDETALAVDPGLTPAIAHAFLDAVRSVTDRPLSAVVLTHWHPDHALGVLCLPERTFPLVATPQTRRALAEHAAAARAAAGAKPAEREALMRCAFNLPDHLVTGHETFDLGGLAVEVFAPGAPGAPGADPVPDTTIRPAHTAGDLAVWCPSEGVLASGDLFLDRSCPDMEEGSVAGLIAALDRLLALPARRVIPGHFQVSGPDGLRRFRDYVAAVHDRVAAAMQRGIAPEDVAGAVSFPEFADLRQFPKYRATFDDNARAAARELAAAPAPPGASEGFAISTRFKLGRNPHQIAFSPSGATAFVALAGSDRVARVDVASRASAGAVDAAPTPLGVLARPDDQILIARFGGQAIERRAWAATEPAAVLEVGAGPSLLVGPLPDGAVLASVERADRLVAFDPATMTRRASYPTGARPFPPAATSDGRLAFVPGYDDGSVTVVDLWNQRVLERVPVGANPSGGAVLPGDVEYAVAVRGEDRIAFINTASHAVVSSLTGGIGRSPFSVVVTPGGRLAFVNNTASNDVSVIALPEKRVVARVPVGEIPIVMAVAPSGETLWVSCEGSHEVDLIDIPARWRKPEAPPAPPHAGRPTEVAVLGMIHGGHRTSPRWGLAQVRETIRRFAPDVVLPEIPPDRWPRVWSEYAERGVIEDPRVRRFPEYTDVLLPLKVQMGFAVEPCAGWTKEMSDLRQARIHAFDHEARFADRRAEYQAKTDAVLAADTDDLGDSDDPHVIHSAAYDARIKAELSLYDRYLNDWIGPGGWTNINRAHYRLIDRAIRRHPGRRLLITFGAGHKYWLLEQLRRRTDIRLLDIGPFLPPP